MLQQNIGFKVGACASLGFGLAMALTSADQALAATFVYEVSVPTQTTNIVNAPLSIPQYTLLPNHDLLEVILEFAGEMIGSVKVESLDAQPSVVSVDIAGDMNLVGPAGVLLFDAMPQATYVYNLSAFDGGLDFAGSSGFSATGLTAVVPPGGGFEVLSFAATEAYVQNNFIGNGNVNFVFNADGSTDVKGSANIASIIQTQANAKLRVTYRTQERQQVPEPSALLGLAGLVGSMGLVSHRRRAESC
jgi:PEP-CTERM motif